MGGLISITLTASIDNRNVRNRCGVMLGSLFCCGAKPIPRRRTDYAVPFKSRSDGTKDGGSRRVDGTMILMTDDGAGRSSTIYTKGFILDSGASGHATSNVALLSGYEPLLHTGRTIRGASEHPLPICGSGSVRTDRFALNDVLFVPGLEKNVVSVSKLAELDYEVDFGKTGCFITDNRTGAIVGQGKLVAGLYELDHLKIPLDGSHRHGTHTHQ